jgi:hypothetical protein
MQPDASVVVPALVPMTRITVEVAGVASLGAAPQGERRFVPLLGGVVQGPELNGTVVQGGVDWQWARADGVLEIAAHYVICATDGSLIEVKSDGLRHGPPQVMARLARDGLGALKPSDGFGGGPA